MNKIKYIVFLVTVMFLLINCVGLASKDTYWSAHNKTEEELKKDFQDCKLQANNRLATSVSLFSTKKYDVHNLTLNCLKIKNWKTNKNGFLIKNYKSQ